MTIKHYHLYHTTMHGDSRTACNKDVRTEHASKIIGQVTCKRCLNRMKSIGERAAKMLRKIVKMVSDD